MTALDFAGSVDGSFEDGAIDLVASTATAVQSERVTDLRAVLAFSPSS